MALVPRIASTTFPQIRSALQGAAGWVPVAVCTPWRRYEAVSVKEKEKKITSHQAKLEAKEELRKDHFVDIWNDLNSVFAGVAKYYDRANHIASMGTWWYLRKRFVGMMHVHPGQKVLDVCAGTNAIGLELLAKEPLLEVHAIDRSDAMQQVGQESAKKRGVTISSTIADCNKRLPYPDNTFDIVTLQYASRHLQIVDVSREVMRILKPGGHFYHCDMLRPESKVVETLYFAFVKFTLNFTAFLFQSDKKAHRAKNYFLDALRLFYSPSEFSEMLEEVGFVNVGAKTRLAGTIGQHKAKKPEE